MHSHVLEDAPLYLRDERGAVTCGELPVAGVGDAEDQDRGHEQGDDRRGRKHPPRRSTTQGTALDPDDHRVCGDVSDALTPGGPGAEHAHQARHVPRRQCIDDP